MISHIYDLDDDALTCCGNACDGETYFWDAMSHVTCRACLRIAAHKFDAIAQQLRDRLDDIRWLEIVNTARTASEVSNRQWHEVDRDTVYAPPFGTIRVCRICGCLVAGGPTACLRCVKDEEHRERTNEIKELREQAEREKAGDVW